MLFEKGSFDSADKYGNLSLQLSLQLNSMSKQSYTYKDTLQLAHHRGDYKTGLGVSEQMVPDGYGHRKQRDLQAIAELEEKYEAREEKMKNCSFRGK